MHFRDSTPLPRCIFYFHFLSNISAVICLHYLIQFISLNKRRSTYIFACVKMKENQPNLFIQSRTMHDHFVYIPNDETWYASYSFSYKFMTTISLKACHYSGGCVLAPRRDVLYSIQNSTCKLNTAQGHFHLNLLLPFIRLLTGAYATE